MINLFAVALIRSFQTQSSLSFISRVIRSSKCSIQWRSCVTETSFIKAPPFKLLLTFSTKVSLMKSMITRLILFSIYWLMYLGSLILWKTFYRILTATCPRDMRAARWFIWTVVRWKVKTLVQESWSPSLATTRYCWRSFVYLEELFWTPFGTQHYCGLKSPPRSFSVFWLELFSMIWKRRWIQGSKTSRVQSSSLCSAKYFRQSRHWTRLLKSEWFFFM